MKNETRDLKAWKRVALAGFLSLSFQVAAPHSRAEEGGLLTVPPPIESTLNAAVPFGVPDPEGSTVTVNLTASCYGTNNRSVMNPLSPSASVNAVMEFTADSAHRYEFTFPAAVTSKAGQSVQASVTVKKVKKSDSSVVNISAQSIGNVISMRVPFVLAAVNTDGTFTQNARASTVSKIAFNQVGASATAGSYQFYGYNGPLTFSQPSYTPSSQGTVLDIGVGFPGQDGFCGGYHSPLMLFTSDKMPAMSGKSRFPLNPDAEEVYWVEPGAEAYFLALDKKGDRQITEADQLFGNNKEFSNGFDALIVLDSNKDSKISAKDKLFKKLVVWRDVNGDGVSQAAEVQSVAEFGLVEIDLKYSKEGAYDFGDRAKAKESAKFKYKRGGKGAVVEGLILDVWFTTAVFKPLAGAKK